MENPLVLKLYLDNRPVSKELQEYIETLTTMTDKLSLELVTDHNDESAPCVKLYKDDIQHYESLRNKYKVMSVPCMVINEEHVYFGKKNIQQILEIVEDVVK